MLSIFGYFLSLQNQRPVLRPLWCVIIRRMTGWFCGFIAGTHTTPFLFPKEWSSYLNCWMHSSSRLLAVSGKGRQKWCLQYLKQCWNQWKLLLMIILVYKPAYICVLRSGAVVGGKNSLNCELNCEGYQPWCPWMQQELTQLSAWGCRARSELPAGKGRPKLGNITKSGWQGPRRASRMLGWDTSGVAGVSDCWQAGAPWAEGGLARDTART